jgi:hypothetical protein
MKLYGRTIFLLTYFLLINNTLGYTQNVGYIRIIDNTDKSNDYKDCQYNRFDDLLVKNMMKIGINIVDFNESIMLSTFKAMTPLTFSYSSDRNFKERCSSSLKFLKSIENDEARKLGNKLKLDYIIYLEIKEGVEVLKCGTDLVLEVNRDWRKSFMILDLKNNTKKKLFLKLKDIVKDELIFYDNKIAITEENFNDQTNVDNFIKDILDVNKKVGVNEKNIIQDKKSNSLTQKNNNNTISNISSFSNPRIMVLPKKIDEKNYQNGEYYLKKEEKMIIASLKKVLEDNKLKTIGFESVIKNISERRLLQSGTKVDLKTLILESNEADFYVEFENLDDGVMLNQNNGNCPKSFDFKIRNYATGEDIASDLQEINTCGSIDEYKKFANKILNNGAITKINDEFQYLVENGKKISIFFSFSNSSNKKFDDKIQGLRISQHIEKCIKENAFNGKFIFGGVVNNYISFPQVSVPFIDKNNNQLYTVPQFSNAIRDYLENYLEVREVTVTGSSINFILN